MGHAWIAKFAALGMILISLTPSSVPRESFDTVALRAARALRRGDWKAFAKDAAPVLLVEERWRVYEDYYFAKPDRYPKPALGDSDEFMLSYVTKIETGHISAKGRKVFAKFASELKSVWQDYPPHPAQGWWKEIDDAESLDSVGRCVVGKIASNLDWALELQEVDGRWRATRMFLMGH